MLIEAAQTKLKALEAQPVAVLLDNPKVSRDAKTRDEFLTRSDTTIGWLLAKQRIKTKWKPKPNIEWIDPGAGSLDGHGPNLEYLHQALELIRAGKFDPKNTRHQHALYAGIEGVDQIKDHARAQEEINRELDEGTPADMRVYLTALQLRFEYNVPIAERVRDGLLEISASLGLASTLEEVHTAEAHRMAEPGDRAPKRQRGGHSRG